MANRKATGPQGKRILANQSVAKVERATPKSKGRSSASASRRASFIRPNGGYLRDLVALVLLAIAVGAMGALISGHGLIAAGTSSSATANSAAAATNSNLLGAFGSAVANRLFSLLGLAAFAVPPWIAFLAMRLFVRCLPGLRIRQWLGLAMLLLGSMAMGHLFAGEMAGGIIGAVVAEGLRAPLETFGAALVAGVFIAAGLVLLTRAAIVRWIAALCGLLLAGFLALCGALRRLGTLGFAKFQEQRAIWQREREEEDAQFEQEMLEVEAAEAARLEAMAASATSLLPSEAPQIVRAGSRLVLQSAPPESLPPQSVPPTSAPSSPTPSMAPTPSPKSEPEPASSLPEPTPTPTPKPEPADPQALSAEAQFFGDHSFDSIPAMPAPMTIALPTTAPKPEIAFRSSIKPMPPPPELDESDDEDALEEPPEPSLPIKDAREPQTAPRPQLFDPKPLPRPVATMPSPSVAVLPKKRDPFAFEGPSSFSLPALDLLAEPRADDKQPLDEAAYYETATRLTEKLATFHIPGVIRRILPGPVVTMYEFEPGPGIKISKISGLADDLAMAMEAISVRIIAPLPGRGVVGIEVPNKTREMICLREIFEQPSFQSAKSKLTFAIGKDVEGQPFMTDLAKMPHLLIAGTTGSGKSVTVNTMIMSMLYRATPEEVRLIMVDPKVTELSIYEGIPHLLLPVVTEPKKAALALQWAVEEMERRYQLLAGASVRNIVGYNAWVEKRQAELQAIEEEKRAAAMQKARAQQQARANANEAVTELPTPAPTNRIRIIDVQDGESPEDAYLRATDGDGLPLDHDASMAVTEPPAPAAIDQNQGEEDNDEDEDRRIDEEALELDARDAYEAEIARFLEAKANEPPQKLPYIVIIIDEVADLMMVVRNEVETQVARLAQKARAAGIHLMLATQRPSADIITGVIKANFPSRISCQLRSWQDSMTILGSKGAEALLGMGDMLILPPTSPNLQRIHGAFVSDEEINRVAEFLRAQGTPIYDESILRPRDEEGEDGEDGGGSAEERDAMYDTCLALVSEMKSVSTSMLQRKLKLGYNRAARIIEQMEREGIVGPANGSKPREVLIRPIGENYKEVNF
jgi:S-DNA-T family DNA segregation ATPase FtsK/SpoIIIE